MTPLHDAASNGNLDVIQLLLNAGASAVAKNYSGEMPLHVLKKWRERAHNLDPVEQSLYDDLVERLSKDMEKLGHSKDIVASEEKNTALIMEDESNLQNINSNREKSKKLEEKMNRIGSLRRNMSFDEDLDNMTSKVMKVEDGDESEENDFDVKIPKCVSKEEKNIRDEYKRVMESVRHPLREENIEKKRKSNEALRKSAYLQSDEVGDDWLEDDLGLNYNKKRRTTSVDTFVNTLGTRKSSSRSLLHPSKSSDTGNDSCESDKEINETKLENLVIDLVGSSDDGDFNTNRNKKRKHQSSLIEQGFTRQRSFSPTTVNSRGSTIQRKKSQTRISTFVKTESNTSLEDLISYDNTGQDTLNKIINTEPTLSVDVRIDGKLYRVPVLASEMHSRTIKWLADEAAKRYSR